MSEQPGHGDSAPATGGPAGSAPGHGNGEPARAARRALWLGGGAIVLTPLFFPAGMALAVAALVVGVRARRHARRDRSAAPGAVAGIVLGVIGVIMASFWLAAAILFYPEMNRYQECMESANTDADEKVCRNAYMKDLEEKLNLPEGYVSRYGGML